MFLCMSVCVCAMSRENYTTYEANFFVKIVKGLTRMEKYSQFNKRLAFYQSAEYLFGNLKRGIVFNVKYRAGMAINVLRFF